MSKYVCDCVNECIYVSIFEHVNGVCEWMHEWMCAYLHVCMWVYVCVCIWTWMSVWLCRLWVWIVSEREREWRERCTALPTTEASTILGSQAGVSPIQAQRWNVTKAVVKWNLSSSGLSSVLIMCYIFFGKRPPRFSSQVFLTLQRSFSIRKEISPSFACEISAPYQPLWWLLLFFPQFIFRFNFLKQICLATLTLFYCPAKRGNGSAQIAAV